MEAEVTGMHLEAKLERDAKIIQMARDEWVTDDLAIDNETYLLNISEGDDNGAWVRAWVWVDFGGTDLDKEAK